MEKIKGRFLENKGDEDILESRRLAPGGKRIRAEVCEFYRVEEGCSLASRRAIFNEPRNMAIYLTRRLRGVTLKEASEALQIVKCGTVRDVLRRIVVNEYKRRQAAPGLKVTSKAFGYGRRYPIARGKEHY